MRALHKYLEGAAVEENIKNYCPTVTHWALYIPPRIVTLELKEIIQYLIISLNSVFDFFFKYVNNTRILSYHNISTSRHTNTFVCARVCVAAFKIFTLTCFADDPDSSDFF